MLKPHIVIVGAGFGGVYVAKRIVSRVAKGEIDVTVINRTNYFLFTPLLHEVATGALGPASVAEPLREVFAHTGVAVIEAEVDSVDLDAQKLKIANHAAGRDSHTIEYDYLVISTGAETNYYGIPGADRFGMPLKTLADAVAIRSRIIDAFEEAVLANSAEERKALLSFAVVGGGPTGVETAAELAEFVSGMTRRHYCKPECSADEPGQCRFDEPSVSLINGGPEILQQFPPLLRTAAADRLRHEGVKLILNSAVASVSAKGIVLADGSTVPASVVVWAAGVKPIIPQFIGTQPQVVVGRLVASSDMRLAGQGRVFVLGDVAGLTPPVPFLAQAAIAQARVVATNLLASISQKPLKSFSYRSKGNMVSVGQRFAIAQSGKINISGLFAWWIWRTVYLFKFTSWRKRFRIVVDWTFDFFLPRDITKLS